MANFVKTMKKDIRLHVLVLDRTKHYGSK